MRIEWIFSQLSMITTHLSQLDNIVLKVIQLKRQLILFVLSTSQLSLQIIDVIVSRNVTVRCWVDLLNALSLDYRC